MILVGLKIERFSASGNMSLHDSFGALTFKPCGGLFALGLCRNPARVHFDTSRFTFALPPPSCRNLTLQLLRLEIRACFAFESSQTQSQLIGT
jgi:hypothetical protein